MFGNMEIRSAKVHYQAMCNAPFLHWRYYILLNCECHLVGCRCNFWGKHKVIMPEREG